MTVLIDYTKGFFETTEGDTVGTVTGGTETYDIANASYDSVSFSVASQDTSVSDLFFKPDGTKFYFCGNAGDDINEYTLSTAWDLSTASFTTNFSVSSQTTSPSAIFFKPDGLVMYVVGSNNRSLNQYTLSTAWDISSASYSQNASVTDDLGPYGLYFKNDGTKAFTTGNAGDEINEYALSTAWDVSTISFTQRLGITTTSPSPFSLFFKPDGYKIFICEVNGDLVQQYDLTTAWDISTASYSNISFDVSSQDGAPVGVYFKSDGAKMYIIGNANDTIYQYSTGTATTIDLSTGSVFSHTPAVNTTFAFTYPAASGTSSSATLKLTGANVVTGYDIANASYDSKDFSPSEDSFVYDIAFKDDGTKLYTVGGQNDKVYQYSLSTAYDISTASYDSKSFSVSSQSTLPTGLSFKTDGTRMFIFDFNNNIVYQYNLSTAWDVSTASYSSTSFTLTGGTDAFDLDFSTDGTKFIVTFRGIGNKVVLYNLSTAWDVSTASFGSEKDVNAQTGTFPTGGTLNADGTKMFVANYSTKYIYQYSLSTAFDLSTASYDSVSFQITSLFSNPSQTSLTFNSDGTKMYSVAVGGNRITQYTTGSSALATITYPASVIWSGGTIPTAPANGETDVYSFYTDDGGTTYYGFQSGDALA